MTKERISETRNFIWRITGECELICRALFDDRQDADLKQRIEDWHLGVFPDGEISGFFPQGRTTELLDKLYPRTGVPLAQEMYQAAIDEVNRLPAAMFFLPKLEAANAAHRALIEQARSLYESGESDADITSHCDAVNAVVDALPAIESSVDDTKKINRKSDIVPMRRTLVRKIIDENPAGRMTPATLRDLMNGKYADKYAKISKDKYDRQDADNDLDAIGYRSPKPSNQSG